jgi:nitrite reductase/ring-hydroxylating ferredoxin subunit
MVTRARQQINSHACLFSARPDSRVSAVTQTDADYQPVLASAELPEGQMRACQLGGRELVICRTRDGLFALDNICTHALARLSEGRLRGQRLICPLHGASFDVRDGRVLGAPAQQPLKTYQVRVHDDRIEVAVGTP